VLSRSLLVIFALASSALAGDAPAAPTPAAAPAPRVRFDAKDWNFGKVAIGDVVTHVFKLTNAGSAPLVIQRVKPSCSCTAALASKSELAPGESGELKVEFNTAFKQGFHDVQIQVFTNDDLEKDLGEGLTVLHLRGEVANFLSIEPPSLYYASPFVRGEAAGERRVKVLPSGEVHEVHALSVEVTSPFFTVHTEPAERGAFKGFEVVLDMKPDIPLGKVAASVLVKTDHPRQPLLTLPVSGVVNGKIAAFPERLLIFPPVGPGPAPKEPTIDLVRLAGKGPIPIEAVETPPCLEAAPPEGGDRRVEIVLKVRAGAPPGPFAGVVRIFLRDAEQPLFEVPVSGEVARRVIVDPPAVWLEKPGASVTLRVSVPSGAKLTGVSTPERMPFAASLDESGRVDVRLREGAEPGRLEGKLTIATDVAGEERIEVPVRGLVPPPPK
jgi:hypothetical protein